MPVVPPSEMTVDEPSQTPDSNKNAIDVVQPRAETVEVEDVNEYDEEESCRDYDGSVKYRTKSSERHSQRTRTKTTRFNIIHENVNKYGYHREIHMQTSNSIKTTFLAANDITPMTDDDQDS